MLIGYGRLSSRDRPLTVQSDALAAVGCEHVFIENASGASRDRPQLKAALNCISSGDTLVVWKLDRLARSVRQLAQTAEDLEQRQVSLRVLSPEIDTSRPEGWLVFHTVSAVAEFDRELALERTHASMPVARAANRRCGRPKALTASQIEQAKAMLADPMVTVEEVAHELGTTTSTLYRHIPGGRSAVAGQAA